MTQDLRLEAWTPDDLMMALEMMMRMRISGRGEGGGTGERKQGW